MRRKKLAVRRKPNPILNDEAEPEIVPDNDCEVVEDGDDEFEEDNGNGNYEDEEDEEPEVLPSVEEVNAVFKQRFGEAVRYDAEESEADSGGDDIWDDDKIPNPLSSDDDEGETEEYVRREDKQDPDLLLALDKTFNDSFEFKSAVLRYSLKTGYDIKYYLSNEDKIGAICSDKVDDCPWKIYCSYEKKKHKLQVKRFVNEHVCVKSGYSKLLKRSTIAQLFDERLRVNPKFLPREMVDEIKRDYNLIITEDQCRKAKTKLFKQRQASHEAHFSRIWDYEAEIKRSNPGTTLDIETVPGPTPGSKQRFDRIFVYFKAQRDVWLNTCRPIIGLDGAFLKWDIKGHLLAAVGRDGDNRIVPIAWAVVEVKNDDNWDWFVRHIRHELRFGDGSKVTIISDKQQGLVKAIHNVLPQGEHRLCARHILGNWRRDNSDRELERRFWKIARSYTEGQFHENMEALKKYNKSAYDSLQKTNPQSWSRAFFRVGSFCNDILNNLNESFNRTIRETRRKPLLELLEAIRRQTMERTVKRSIIANRLKTRFTKSAHAEIEDAKTKSKDCIRFMATGDRHEVELYGCGFRVDMNLKTCGCGKWQLVGIPCPHFACVITAKKQHVSDFVSEYYTTQMWRKTYEESIEPVEGKLNWPITNRLGVLPPGNRKANRGRPNNHARKKGRFETASSSSQTKLTRENCVMKCSNCQQEGRNKLSCKNAYVPTEPKMPRGRGRPRKIQEGAQEGAPQFLQTAASQGSLMAPSQGSHIGPSQGPT